MTHSTLLVILALGCGNSAGVLDAKTDPAVCKLELESSIDRACSVAGDCVLVRSADCCGAVILAVKRGTEAGFPAVEATYETCLACPPLGCAHTDLVEDGSGPGVGETIVATCDTGRCKSIVQ